MTETTRQPTSQPTSQQASAPRGPYRVVIVDDHAMFRTGVKAEIGRSVAVVGEAADADRAIAVVLHTRPAVVLLDVHLPGGGGGELIDAIRRVAEGDAVFSARLAGFVLDAFSGSIDLATVDEDLDRLSQ